MYGYIQLYDQTDVRIKVSN